MAITVKLDKYGKIFIPKSVRSQLDTEEFQVQMVDGVVELIPIRTPLDLYGTLSEVDDAEVQRIEDDGHGSDD